MGTFNTEELSPRTCCGVHDYPSDKVGMVEVNYRPRNKCGVTTFFVLAIVAVIFLLIFSGCTAVVVGAAAGTAGSTAGGVFLNETKRQDNLLAERVKGAFASHPEWQKYRLDAASENGVVTVYGFVPSKVAKEQILQVARDVPEVKGVISRVTFIPPGMMEASSRN